MTSTRVSLVTALLVAGCTPLAPTAQQPAPSAPPAATVATVEVTSQRLPREPISFPDLFLRAEDLREGMRSVVSLEESRPNHPNFVCLGGPGGNQSAFVEWGDPDSREALWRIVDLRWLFDDDESAEAFRAKLITHFEKKEWRTTPCPTPLGEACTRVVTGPWSNDGRPHTEIGFLFRVGNVVAEVTGAEGPRVAVDKQRLDDNLVVPFARRAEKRVLSSLRP